MNEPQLNVLVVDDDEITAESVFRALRKLDLDFRVVAAMDGQDALDVLRGRGGPDRDLKRPYIILLDLNMPRMNGFEFLEQLRGDAALRDSVVFVLSTSDSDEDRTRAYQDQIAGYMVKSAVGPQFARLSRLLREFAAAVSMP